MVLGELFQSADYKSEKHVPVIELQGKVVKGEYIDVVVSVGKEVTHPNTTEHHISWIEVYFKANGQKNPHQLGRFEFMAHGASVDGPNKSGIYTNPKTVCSFKVESEGIIIASSYCNIHGLWQSSKEVNL